MAATPDLLDLLNRLDRAWHGQPQTYEREALTRFLQLVTLPARLVHSGHRVRETIVLRNTRFCGRSVHEFFFEDQSFTEVDGIFARCGSALGHARGGGSYVVEVERKPGGRNADYLRAIRRARKIAALLERRFADPVWPALIYDDRGGDLSYARHEDGLITISMTHLRTVTDGLRATHPDEIPGRAGDRTQVKLDLLWQLACCNPDDPWTEPRTAAGLVNAARRADLDLRKPVVGHQDLEQVPAAFDRWLETSREPWDKLIARVDGYLSELAGIGLIEPAQRGFVLTSDGADVVLACSEFREAG